MARLTHFDDAGQAHMVDVGGKPTTQRIAVTEGWIAMAAETLALIREGGHEKGDVLGIARIAGIMAAKRASDLIPLCHPLPLTHVSVDLEARTAQNRVHCRAVCKTNDRTGVEMEALTATQIALLTVYDMCKAVDRSMTMGGIRLLEKDGGKSGRWVRDRVHDQT